MEKAIKFSAEVADALKARKPVVALESTIISHGLPRPSNLEVALECERIVREAGAVPATIALLDGKVLVGLERPELEAIANRDDIAKASIRDLAIIVAQGKSAATTVAQQLLILQRFQELTSLQQVALVACTEVPMSHLMNQLI